MKRLLVLAMVLTMALVFTACSNEAEEIATAIADTDIEQSSELTATEAPETQETPAIEAQTADTLIEPATDIAAFVLYSNAFAALDDVDSLAMRSLMETSMYVDGESFDMVADMTMYIVALSPTDFHMQVDSVMDMGLLGQVSSSMFFRDGYMYMTGEMMGGSRESGFRMPLALEDAMEMLGADALNATFEEHMIQSYEMRDVPGGTEVDFVIVGMAELFDDLFDSVFAMLGDGLYDLDMDIELGDVFFSMLVDNDGNLVHFDMNMDMSISAEGETIRMSSTSRTEIIQIGGVSVSFPAYLDSFAELPGMLF